MTNADGFTAVREKLNRGSTLMVERDEYSVPADAIEALARCLLPVIRSYFESDEGKSAFAEWKSQQSAEKPSVPAQKKLAG